MGLTYFGQGYTSTSKINIVIVPRYLFKVKRLRDRGNQKQFFMKKLFLISIVCATITVHAQFKFLSNGNAGLATTNPLTTLQIYDDYTKIAVGSANTLTDGISYLGLNAVRQSNGTWLSANNGAKNGSAIIYGDLNGSINFATIASTGSSNQTFSNTTVSSNTMVKFGTICYIATGTNNPPSGIRNYFKGWKTAFDNGVYATTLYFDLSNSDPRIYSTRNGVTGDPQIVFYNSSVGYEDVKARSFIVASDASLKNNVTTLSNCLEKVKQLRGVSFNWNNAAASAPKSFGFIAQEVEQVIPEVVFTDDTAHIKTMNYIALIPYLVEAIKEQNSTIQQQSTEIELLKKIIQDCCKATPVNPLHNDK